MSFFSFLRRPFLLEPPSLAASDLGLRRCCLANWQMVHLGQSQRLNSSFFAGNGPGAGDPSLLFHLASFRIHGMFAWPILACQRSNFFSARVKFLFCSAATFRKTHCSFSKEFNSLSVKTCAAWSIMLSAVSIKGRLLLSCHGKNRESPSGRTNSIRFASMTAFPWPSCCLKYVCGENSLIRTSDMPDRLVVSQGTGRSTKSSRFGDSE
mmetsp:Transcript_15060/g.36766  ORF Transcript_15060/g.36766 Transcript_15060/m.36766 type:complete len:209 (+) Transcript_15060:4254-4880(+)